MWNNWIDGASNTRSNPKAMIIEQIEGGDIAHLYPRLSLLDPPLFILHSGMEPRTDTEYPLARYSFMGWSPFAVLSAKRDEVRLCRCDGSTLSWHGDPFEALRGLLKRWNLPNIPQTPLPAGAVGYLAYDLKAFTEPVSPHPNDDLNLPDMFLAFYDAVITFDHAHKRLIVTSTGLPESGERARIKARERMEEMLNFILSGPAALEKLYLSHPFGELVSSFSKPDYVRAIEEVKGYIAAGDIYQANIAQRFSLGWEGNALGLFLKLSEINPAPFSAYLDPGGFQVVSSSPERFLRFDPATRLIHTRPIKGTRPRGEGMGQELMRSEKDSAEHIMIVDLERNDLGKIAEIGSVWVPELKVLEPFPTVYHLTSTVEAKVKKGCDLVDILRATFPGGSITGAPKIRAMEIIDEVEPVGRSIYTGSIGYLSFSGHMDLNIVIRTIFVLEGRVHFYVGGGIVADSDPEMEYQETLDKGKALVEALCRMDMSG